MYTHTQQRHAHEDNTRINHFVMDSSDDRRDFLRSIFAFSAIALIFCLR